MSYKQLIKDLWHSFRYKPETDKKLLKDDKPMNWSLYNNKEDEKTSDVIKRFNFIHGFIKYTLLMPGMFIIDKVFNKRIITTVPDYWYNKNFQLMDKAFEETIINSERYYDALKQFKKTKPQRKISKQRMKKLISGRHYNLMRRFKNIFFSVVLMDSFYRNFFDEYVIVLANQIHKEYDGKTYNIIKYTGNSMINYDYYIIGEVISKGEKDVQVNVAKIKTDEELEQEVVR